VDILNDLKLIGLNVRDISNISVISLFRDYWPHPDTGNTTVIKSLDHTIKRQSNVFLLETYNNITISQLKTILESLILAKRVGANFRNVFHIFQSHNKLPPIKLGHLTIQISSLTCLHCSTVTNLDLLTYVFKIG
jgi:hypothetical protein